MAATISERYARRAHEYAFNDNSFRSRCSGRSISLGPEFSRWLGGALVGKANATMNLARPADTKRMTLHIDGYDPRSVSLAALQSGLSHGDMADDGCVSATIFQGLKGSRAQGAMASGDLSELEAGESFVTAVAPCISVIRRLGLSSGFGL